QVQTIELLLARGRSYGYGACAAAWNVGPVLEVGGRFQRAGAGPGDHGLPIHEGHVQGTESRYNVGRHGINAPVIHRPVPTTGPWGAETELHGLLIIGLRDAEKFYPFRLPVVVIDTPLDIGLERGSHGSRDEASIVSAHQF